MYKNTPTTQPHHHTPHTTPPLAPTTATSTVGPLVSYFGHVSSLVKKQGGITPAEFYDRGKYVLISGEGSQRLSVYEASTGLCVYVYIQGYYSLPFPLPDTPHPPTNQTKPKQSETGHAVSRGLLGAEVSQIAVLENESDEKNNVYRPSLLVAERKGAIGRLDPF